MKKRVTPSLDADAAATPEEHAAVVRVWDAMERGEPVPGPVRVA
jgi:hypothetical protein